MDWAYPRPSLEVSDASGVAVVIDRLASETDGPPLRGTRILYTYREMIEATREVEEAVADGDELLVGFQVPEKLNNEHATYAALAERGVRLVLFGAGPGEPPEGDVRWVEVPMDRAALENQWFLVATGSVEIAFVGYDISDADSFGVGGISDPARRFVGFVTDDARIVSSLRGALMEVAGDPSGRAA